MLNTNFGLNFVGGLLLGSMMGAIAALLLAPDSGQGTRAQLMANGDALKRRVQAVGDATIQQAQTLVEPPHEFDPAS